MHGLTLEVRSKRPLPIGTILKSFVTVSAKCTGQNADVAKNTLKYMFSVRLER